MKGLGPFLDWTPTPGGKLIPCANNFLHFFRALTHIYELITRKHQFSCLFESLYKWKCYHNIFFFDLIFCGLFCFVLLLNILLEISLLMDSGVIYYFLCFLVNHHMNTPQCIIHSTIDRHFGVFPIFAFTNFAAINIPEHVSRCTYQHVVCRSKPVNELCYKSMMG